MQGHRPDEAFTPAVESEFGKDAVVVIQDAQGGQPIHRWYKDWKAPDGSEVKQIGDLYDRLMGKVKPAIKDKKLASVTFAWMQGERDAKMKWSEAYEAALLGLLDQVREDVGTKDINFIIGRLSDFDMDNKKYPHWTKIREVQEKVAKSSKKFALINTDDLNDGKNRRGKAIKDDLHYSAEGYKTFGKRMAEAAIERIQ